MSIFKISTQKSHALHPTCKPWLLSVPLFQLFSIFEMISALLFPYLSTRSFILIILVNPIIVIQQILCPIKSEHSKCRHINLLHRFSHFCDRDAFSFPDEQRYFVQCDHDFISEHQRDKYTKRQVAQQKFSCRIRAESAQISTRIKKENPSSCEIVPYSGFASVFSIFSTTAFVSKGVPYSYPFIYSIPITSPSASTAFLTHSGHSQSTLPVPTPFNSLQIVAPHFC